ncbi:thioredoxin [Gordonia sp. PKS22-38]|uniref:Thioredoxin n=1 Tax=Gordonia prachuapensis TaxID=3115651 RepID=A0ABU7MYC2_9ACTN|nr:thioredoxin [Gordonia sp. PKS22-38]
MSTREITLDNLQDTIGQEGIVMLDFWAGWCGPCKMFAPVFEKAAEANTDIVFGKVDTEAEQQLASGFGIRSIPTLMAFRDGVLVFNQAGALPAAQLDELIGAVRGLDMDQVRAEIAAAEQDQSGS